MPELPEVETIKRDLESYILGKRIVQVNILEEKIVKNRNNSFVSILKNNSIKAINRIGKLLIFNLTSGEKSMLVHLKMTGQLVYLSGKILSAGGHSLNQKGGVIEQIGGELPNKHTCVVFVFDDDSTLFYNDLRKFGYIEIIPNSKLGTIYEKFGIEPLTNSYTLGNFKKAIKTRKTNIKAVLLNQGVIAGIGNIYADEILFLAGVNPGRLVGGLTGQEIESIFHASQKIIKKAIINRGTTFSDYLDGRGKKGNFVKLLKVYGRTGQKCNKCGHDIKKIRLAQRGTHYCDFCQK